MSKATLLYLKERPVASESQGSQSNPSAGAVAKEQKRPDTTTRYRSNSDMLVPSSRDSAKPNVNSSSRGQSLDGSAEAHAHPVHDEGGMAVASSSKEHNVDITANQVTALRAPQHFRR